MRDILQAMGRTLAAALCAAACLGHAAAAAPADAAPGDDRPIRIGLQNAIAPFVMPGHQSGMLVDVMRAALASQRVRAEFIYLPNVRMEQALRDGTAIYASGEIDRIIERYRDEHGTTRDFCLALDCHFRPAHPKACRELTGR